METRQITQKYWNALPEDSKFRALRKVCSNFPDTTLRAYAKMRAKEMSFVWELVKRHVKQTTDSHYKTCVDKTYMA